jgi:hypothetical protein
MAQIYLDVQRWLYTTLDTALTGTAAAGNLYGEFIPQNGAYPAVVYSVTSGTPAYRVSNPIARGWETLTILTKTIVQGSSYVPAESIADAIYTALQNGYGTGGSTRVRYCIRESQQPMPPTLVDGVEYRTLADTWRIQAYQTL